MASHDDSQLRHAMKPLSVILTDACRNGELSLTVAISSGNILRDFSSCFFFEFFLKVLSFSVLMFQIGTSLKFLSLSIVCTVF